MTVEQLIEQLDRDQPDWVIDFASDHEIRTYARHQFREIPYPRDLKWTVALRIFPIARAAYTHLVESGQCAP